MRQLFRDIDQLLRGGFTRPDDLVQGRIRIPSRPLVLASLILGVLYGAFMGLYALLRTPPTEGMDGVLQLLATASKVPLLFLLTLLVTFPSLYAFSALCGSRLDVTATLRLLLGAIAVNLALLASFGPVIGFFTASTDSYPFMVVLNVVFMAISGAVGLGFLRRALGLLFLAPETPQGPDGDEGEATAPEPRGDAPGERRPPPLRAEVEARRRIESDDRPRRVFTAWSITYAIVGAQMGWVLRPFIGNPDLPFSYFRARGSNFFQAVLDALGRLAG